MSSALASTANVKQGSAFFVVVTAFTDGQDALTDAGAAITNPALDAKLNAGAVLRDMGKTIRIPGNLQTGTKQEVLRKVQLVDTAAMTALVAGVPANNSFVGFNEGVGGLKQTFGEFYVRIRPNGATGPVCVASLGL